MTHTKATEPETISSATPSTFTVALVKVSAIWSSVAPNRSALPSPSVSTSVLVRDRAISAAPLIDTGPTTRSTVTVPPSMIPLIEPAASKTKVSSLPSAPVRFSTSLNRKDPISPAFGPVTRHSVSPVGPRILSLPAPPSKITEGTSAPDITTDA